MHAQISKTQDARSVLIRCKKSCAVSTMHNHGLSAICSGLTVTTMTSTSFCFQLYIIGRQSFVSSKLTYRPRASRNEVLNSWHAFPTVTHGDKELKIVLRAPLLSDVRGSGLYLLEYTRSAPWTEEGHYKKKNIGRSCKICLSNAHLDVVDHDLVEQGLVSVLQGLQRVEPTDVAVLLVVVGQKAVRLVMHLKLAMGEQAPQP